ncbi:MAG: hypothetical protein ABIP33_07755, partial [Pseudolysinimonas sp.]
MHSYFVEGDGDAVEILIEEIRVDIQGHRGRGVSEHSLHDLDVRAGRHREARGRVAKLVGRQAAQPDRCRGRIEPPDPEHVIAQPGAGADAIEHRPVGGAALDLLREQCRQERRDRDRPVLVVLRRLDALVALVGDDCLLDLEPAAIEVDVAHAEAGELAPTEAAVGQREDDRVVAVAGSLRAAPDLDRESGNLVVREVALRVPDLLRQLEPLRRVRRDAPILDRELQRAGEDVHDLPDALRGAGKCGGPLLHAEAVQLAKRDSAEPRRDVVRDDTDDARAGRRAQVGASGEPNRHPAIDGRAGLDGVDVDAATLVELDAGEKELSLTLRREAALLRLDVIWAPEDHAIAATVARFVWLDASHSSPSIDWTIAAAADVLRGPSIYTSCSYAKDPLYENHSPTRGLRRCTSTRCKSLTHDSVIETDATIGSRTLTLPNRIHCRSDLIRRTPLSTLRARRTSKPR